MHPAYFQTRFRFEPPQPELPRRWVIISAHATTGETWDPAREEAADARLKQELAALGVWHHRVVGFSPDGDHAEPSWAAELSFEEGCDLGLRFRQDAIYVVANGTLFLSYCDERRGLVPVGPVMARIEGG